MVKKILAADALMCKVRALTHPFSFFQKKKIIKVVTEEDLNQLLELSVFMSLDFNPLGGDKA